MTKFLATQMPQQQMTWLINDEPGFGASLFLYIGEAGICDYHQNDLQSAMAVAQEWFGILPTAWQQKNKDVWQVVLEKENSLMFMIEENMKNQHTPYVYYAGRRVTNGVNGSLDTAKRFANTYYGIPLDAWQQVEA